jgi:transposase
MLRYLKNWMLQLRWQRLPAFDKLALMLADHVDGILNHCRVKVRFGVVEAVNGNIKRCSEEDVDTRICTTCCSTHNAWP